MQDAQQTPDGIDPAVARRRGRGRLTRALAGAASMLDPRALLHGLRLIHYYNYTHVAQVRLLDRGDKVRLAPNVSFANAERIRIGDRVQIGARCTLWAGDHGGRISIGADTTFGPDCLVTASNYGTAAGMKVVEQPKDERDVTIGADVWLGAKVVVTAGVTIGDGCIVGAGAVVSRDLPAGAICAGAPARPVRMRDGTAVPPL